MQILKQTMVAAILVLATYGATAQNEAALQKAFSDSYTQEYYKKYTDAIASITKVNNDENYETNLRLGWLFYVNKNYAQSQAHYQKAVEIKPYSIEAKLGLVKPLLALESWEKVLQQYEDILKIDNQNYTANYWLGIIYYNKKNMSLV